MIKEHLGQIKLDDLSVEKEELLVKSLIKLLSSEKQEGRLCLILKRVKKTQQSFGTGVLNKMAQKLIIYGAGLTGIGIAEYIRQSFPVCTQ